MGLRLQLRKQQAEAGDIVLLYGDESEALTHPYLAHAWAKSGADLRVPAPGQAKKVAMLGSLDHVARQLIVHTSPTKRSSDFIAHLEQLDRLFGPQPGRQAKPVVLVEDNGPIHTSKRSLVALAARAHWLTVEWLPKYAPELNEIEPVWHDLKAHHLAHQTFTDVAALDQAIHDAVIDLNRERIPGPLAMPRISASEREYSETAAITRDASNVVQRLLSEARRTGLIAQNALAEDANGVLALLQEATTPRTMDFSAVDDPEADLSALDERRRSLLRELQDLREEIADVDRLNCEASAFEIEAREQEARLASIGLITDSAEDLAETCPLCERLARRPMRARSRPRPE